jgi:hypothetical protein
MDIAKIKEGKHFNYRTPRGTTGRGKVTFIDNRPSGAWITLLDKDSKREVMVRPGMLTA